MKPENLYKECEWCQTLEDCPHVEVEYGTPMSLPMPPDGCPRPIDIMNATVKKRKLRNLKIGKS